MPGNLIAVGRVQTESNFAEAGIQNWVFSVRNRVGCP
jgi:hypothetical protein